jgi:hypothetical protein
MKKFARLEASLYSRYGSWREPKGVRDATLQLPRCDARTRRLREARKAGRCRPVVERRVGRACLRRGVGRGRRAMWAGRPVLVSVAPLAIAASVGVISRASAMASADATLVLGRCLRWRYLPSQRDGLCRRDACPRSLPPLALSPEPARWPLPTRRLSSVAQFSNFIQVHALVTNRNYAR